MKEMTESSSSSVLMKVSFDMNRADWVGLLRLLWVGTSGHEIEEIRVMPNGFIDGFANPDTRAVKRAIAPAAAAVFRGTIFLRIRLQAAVKLAVKILEVKLADG
jgi:hypothetical protein